jgi:hypothetical protein
MAAQMAWRSGCPVAPNSAKLRLVVEQRRNRCEARFKFNPAAIDLGNVPLPPHSIP